MGLDQYAYSIDKKGKRHDIAYWRKHPSLQGWMEDLWRSKGAPGKPDEENPHGFSEFNCVPVELSVADLDSLERAVNTKMLPETAGFFFGDDSSEHYRQEDIEFIEKARKALTKKHKVFYDSWW